MSIHREILLANMREAINRLLAATPEHNRYDEHDKLLDDIMEAVTDLLPWQLNFAEVEDPNIYGYE